MTYPSKIDSILNCSESVDLILRNVHAVFKPYCGQLICSELRPYVILSGGSIVKNFQDWVIEAVTGRFPHLSMTGYGVYDNTTSTTKMIKADLDFFIWKKPPHSVIRSQYYHMKRLGISLKKVDKSKYFINGKKRRAITIFYQDDMIQFIPLICNNPSEVVNNFDFEHLKIYYDCEKQTIVYDPNILKYICFGEVVGQPNITPEKDRLDKWIQHMEHYRKVIGLT